MKKSFILFLILCLILPIGGCKKPTEEEMENTITIYYLNREETKIQGASYLLRGTDAGEQIQEVLEIMGEPHEKKAFVPVLSGEIGTPEYFLVEDQLTLNFNENYTKMPSYKEVLVRAALVRSLAQIKGVSFVQFQINGEAFLNRSGEFVGLMTADQFIDNEGDEINVYDEVAIQLYFANEAGDKLVPVKRTVEFNTNISMEKLVMDQLIHGPDNSGSYPTINPSAKVINVTVTDGTCYVNFSKDFLTQVYNVNSEVTVYSIVNSLTALNQVNKVQILVEGDSKVTFRESVNLESTFGRNLDLVEE